MKVGVLTLFFLLCANSIFGCTCTNKSPDKYIEEAKAILIGKVVSIKHQTDSRDEQGNMIIPPLSDAKVEVLKAWKGVENSEVTIQVYAGSTCNDIEEGQTVLLFLYGDRMLQEGGRCPRLKTTEADINKKLGEGKTFEKPAEQPKVSNNQVTEGFWTQVWQKMVSLFS